MNSRAKTLFGRVVLVFLSCFTLLGGSNLTRADELNWESLNTDHVKIENDSSGQGNVISSYPKTMQVALNQILSWEPDVRLQDLDYLAKLKNSSLPEGLKNLSVHFDLSSTQNFRKIWFQLNPELRVRGLLGIHDFKKKRPLIILRMGIHGNVDELFAERFLAKAIYNDLDCNFLILENITSHSFLATHQKFTYGGMEEGLHTFLILSLINQKKYPLQKIIESVHLLGVSMGGQGTFVTALLDQSNGKKIKSVLNMCPLINLKATTEFHAKSTFKEMLIDFWNFHRMNILYRKNTIMFEKVNMWKSIFDFTPRFMPRLIEILQTERKTTLLSVQDLQKQIPNLNWPLGFLKLLTQSNSFFKLNEFWPYFRNVEVPITIYTTSHDPLVINEINSDKIVNKTQPGDFQNTKVIQLEKGVHCGLASVYPWPEVVEMIKKGLF